EQAIDGGEGAVVRLVVPQLTGRAAAGAGERAGRLSPSHVGDHHRERVAATEGGALQAGDLAPRGCRILLCSAAAAASAERRGAAAGAPATSRRTGRSPDAAGALLRLLPEREARTADEGDALAVRRPCRTRVAVHARRDVADRACASIVHGDEGVVRALA